MFLSITTLSQNLDMTWQDTLDAAAFGDLPAPIVAAGRLRWRTADIDQWEKTGCPKSAELSDDEYMELTGVLLDELKANDTRKDS